MTSMSAGEIIPTDHDGNFTYNSNVLQVPRL
jgi:hypothetical protein